MSDKSARANRYAQAVFQAMLERWQTALGQVSDVLSKNQPLATTLQDTSKSMADKAAALGFGCKAKKENMSEIHR